MVLRGFSNYFKIANISQILAKLLGWVRRRLRAVQLRLWKRVSKLHQVLEQRKYKPPFKSIKMNSWRNAASPLANYSMPNKWFEELGLYDLSKVKIGELALYN